MAKNVKKFILTYDSAQKLFSLPEDKNLDQSKDSLILDEKDQTKEQKAHIAATIDQMDCDAERTCYVDFSGLKASELKSDWLTRSISGETKLSQGVFPSFAQGDSTGASIGEILHATQCIIPLGEKEPQSLDALMKSTKKICFSYRTDAGKPAGFSLTASATGDKNGKHKGWIITTIENTTGHYKDRKVTVLASSNYLTTPAQTMIAMDNSKSIETELKAAIHNDKIVQLMKRIFNQDGSLNESEINHLHSRIKASINIDDRDRKVAQFNCLIQWSQQDSNTIHAHPGLTEDIDFFHGENYAVHLKKKLEELAFLLKKNSQVIKKTTQLTEILNNISSRVASFEMLAEKSYKNIELAHTYKTLAKRILTETKNLKFDGSEQDENKITFLSQFDIDKVQKKIQTFYKTDPKVLEYYLFKNQSNDKVKEKLNQITRPPVNSFFSNNGSAIGLSVLPGLLTAAVLGTILFPLVSPLTLALILIGTTLAIGGALSGVGIYNNEKKQLERINQYHEEISSIRLEHIQGLEAAEQKLQQGINVDAFLEPDKPEFLQSLQFSKRKPLTPERVAHTLWLHHKDAKTTSTALGQFGLWAVNQKLGFGNKEVNEVINKTYVME